MCHGEQKAVEALRVFSGHGEQESSRSGVKGRASSRSITSVSVFQKIRHKNIWMIRHAAKVDLQLDSSLRIKVQKIDFEVK